MKKTWKNPEVEMLSVANTATSVNCYEPGTESSETSIPAIKLFPADKTYPECGPGGHK